MAKSKMGVVDATLEMLTKPHFIINYLSRADGITGHQFTAFYQRTQRYQELKRKVLAKEPLSAEEAICYTLTRDCKVLPIHLKKAMDAVELDENTREHLKLIMTLSEEIRAIQDQLKGVIHAKGVNYYKTKLLDHLNRHHRQHPHQFVNLFGADLSGLQLTDIDFSYLNLSGVQFSNADLRGANFRGAYLGALTSAVRF